MMTRSRRNKGGRPIGLLRWDPPLRVGGAGTRYLAGFGGHVRLRGPSRLKSRNELGPVVALNQADTSSPPTASSSPLHHPQHRRGLFLRPFPSSFPRSIAPTTVCCHPTLPNTSQLLFQRRYNLFTTRWPPIFVYVLPSPHLVTTPRSNHGHIVCSFRCETVQVPNVPGTPTKMP